MELGDKETVAICIQANVTCYLHVIHRYTRMVRTIRVWSYRMRMVYKIVPYAYGTYRIWYVPYAYGINTRIHGTEQCYTKKATNEFTRNTYCHLECY